MIKRMFTALAKSRTALIQPEHTDGASLFEQLYETSRDQWGTKTDYLLSMIGYAVGLGNIWRFPYLIYKNGGGAFVIPYIIMSVTTGLPLFFLECALGQFSSLGPISVWKAVPILQGVGVAMVVVTSIISLYYNCIIAYSIYYMFVSFQYHLPWTECNDAWNETTTCSRNYSGVICNISLPDGTSKLIQNKTCLNGTLVEITRRSPAESYWHLGVLQRSASINETGGVVWYLALCLLLAWLFIVVMLFKGIKSSGKVVYFTATFPYLILLMVLVRGVTLEGASNGIDYYIGKQSDFSKLYQAEVWKDATAQIFFSISISLGGITALSSYNEFNNNCYQDAIIITTVNSLTSLFAGFANFAILGHIAFKQRTSIEKIVESGFGLVFITYPDALSHLPIAPFWSVLFFMMLISLGIDSQFALIETITTSIIDKFPRMRFKFLPMLFTICIFFYVLSLLLVTKAGIYWVKLIDTFVTGWSLLFIGFMELVGVICIYGKYNTIRGNRFIMDIEMMIGKKNWLFWFWWKLCWFFVSPTIILVILLWAAFTFQPPMYGSKVYPAWSVTIGWLIFSVSAIWIPIIAAIQIFHAKGSNLYEKVAATCRPTADWGPRLKEHRGERYGNQIDLNERRHSGIVSETKFNTEDSYV